MAVIVSGPLPVTSAERARFGDSTLSPHFNMSTQALKLNRDVDLKGQSCAVAGGSQGIGAAVAVRFAQAGCDQVFIIGRNADKGAEVVEQLKRAGASKAEFIKADLR